MSFANSLNKFIDKTIDNRFLIQEAIVRSINETNYTCDVETSSAKITSVSLEAFINNKTEDTTPKMVIIPKVDSLVLVISRYHGAKPFIVKYSEVEKVIIVSGNTNIVVDNEKVSIVSDKIYLNVDPENESKEPVVRGLKLKDHLDNIYNYIKDLYSRIGSHIHPSLSGPTSPASPPDDLATLNLTVIPQVEADKGNAEQVKSTKNFTE
jgi:hypothetical protein